MDRSLFRQLWSLYEGIQEMKQIQDKMSETNSECSSISCNTEGQLETIHDFREHVYENETFHSHIYENHAMAIAMPADATKHDVESIYEPVYLKPQCHSSKSGREKRTSLHKNVKKSSSSLSYESSL